MSYVFFPKKNKKKWRFLRENDVFCKINALYLVTDITL